MNVLFLLSYLTLTESQELSMLYGSYDMDHIMWSIWQLCLSLKSMHIPQRYCLLKNCYNCRRILNHGYPEIIHSTVCKFLLTQLNCCEFYTHQSLGILFWENKCVVKQINGYFDEHSCMNLSISCKVGSLTSCWGVHSPRLPNSSITVSSSIWVFKV